MRKIFQFVALASLAIVSSSAVAQSTSEPTPAKLLSAPTVEASVHGNVLVRVSVNANGSVDNVLSVVGPGAVCSRVTRADIVALRESAAKAALSAKFAPAVVNGQPSPGYSEITFGGVEEKPTESKSEKTQNYTVIGTQTGTEPGSRQLSGGPLNGKALSIPKPSYPRAAMAVRASGAVSVKVVIDESGDMFSASAISGHPLLRSAATLAACGAKFSPTLLGGDPVKVAGVITYNFVSP